MHATAETVNTSFADARAVKAPYASAGLVKRFYTVAKALKVLCRAVELGEAWYVVAGMTYATVKTEEVFYTAVNAVQSFPAPVCRGCQSAVRNY